VVQDFIPIIDAGKREVIHIDFPPHYKSGMDGLPRLSTEIKDAPSLTVDALEASGRERIKPPLKKFDFLADLLARTEGFEERGDLKPLHVVQPEGVGFTMKGHVLEWQKWRMHIGNSRAIPASIEHI
jgi:primary-amine oxidase